MRTKTDGPMQFSPFLGRKLPLPSDVKIGKSVQPEMLKGPTKVVGKGIRVSGDIGFGHRGARLGR